MKPPRSRLLGSWGICSTPLLWKDDRGGVVSGVVISKGRCTYILQTLTAARWQQKIRGGGEGGAKKNRERERWPRGKESSQHARVPTLEGPRICEEDRGEEAKIKTGERR